MRIVLRKCLTCFRVKPIDNNYLMGDLPLPRVTPIRPFTISGVDYADPIIYLFIYLKITSAQRAEPN